MPFGEYGKANVYFAYKQVRPHLNKVYMKQILIGLFNLIIFSSLAQVNVIEKWPQIEIVLPETKSTQLSVSCST